MAQLDQITNMETLNPFNRSIFIDTSRLSEIIRWNSTGVIDGVTTNQSIMAKDGVLPESLDHVVQQICWTVGDKPVSVELSDSTASFEDMLEEAQRLYFLSIAENIVIKIPIIPGTTKSLDLAHKLGELGIAVNLTAIMTYEQMVMAALAVRENPNPSFISLFWARSMENHDIRNKNRDSIFKVTDLYPEPAKLGPESVINSHPGIIVAATKKFLEEGKYNNPKIIVGSIRNASSVGEAFNAGAHIVTITPPVLEAMLYSQRTVETNNEFDLAWKKLTTAKV